MERRTFSISSVLVGLAVAGLLVLVSYGVLRSQDYEPSLLSTGNLELLDIPVYEISSRSDEEILFLTYAGGMGSSFPQYRLFGDGRLVREFVYNKEDRTPWAAQETQLAPTDVELLFQLIVSSELPDLSKKRIQQKIGRPPLRAHDAATTILHLRFDSYQRLGEEAEAGYEPQVSMTAPGLQARYFPELAEAQALVTLGKALDEFFSRPASEVIYGSRN